MASDFRYISSIISLNFLYIFAYFPFVYFIAATDISYSQAPDDENFLSTKIYQRASDSLAKFIVENTIRSTSIMTAGRNLRAEIVKKCGYIPGRFYSDTVTRENPHIELDHNGNFERTTFIQLPDCVYFGTGEESTATVRNGDTLFALLQRHMGVSGKKTIKDVLRLNSIENPDRINIGQIIKFPYITRENILNVDVSKISIDNFSKAFFGEYNVDFRGFEDQEYCTDLEKNSSAKSAGILSYCRLKGFEIVEPASFNTGRPGDCGGYDGDLGFDPKKFVTTLLEVKQSRPPISFERPIVVVADTGLRGIHQNTANFDDFIKTRGLHVYANDGSRPVFGEAMTDNRGKRSNLQPPASYGSFGARAHGTHVLGILTAVNKELSESENSPIRSIGGVIIAKLVNEYIGRPIISPNEIRKSLIYAHKRANILNLSVQRGYEIEGFIEEYPRNILTVVAAGNKGFLLGDRDSYPAMFGGEQMPYVITVGAHTRSGDRWYYSNYGRDYVDLFAVGCNIKSIVDMEEKSRIYSGTSQATPIVTNVAQALYYLGVREPEKIKARINSSVDVDQNMFELAMSSGRLNIEKALHIESDVVEYCITEVHDGWKCSNSNKKLLFGTIQDSQIRCGRQYVLSKGRLLKYSPNKFSVGDPHWIVRVDSGKNIKYERCSGPVGDISVKLQNGNEIRVKANQIMDIVFSKFFLD